MARTFSGSGWAWVRRLPPCLPVTVSFRILTRRPNALLLYSGPLAPHPRHHHAPSTPMLAVELSKGHLQLLLEGGREPLKLVVNTTLNDGDWHTIHLHLHPQSGQRGLTWQMQSYWSMASGDVCRPSTPSAWLVDTTVWIVEAMVLFVESRVLWRCGVGGEVEERVE
ncbi:Neural-cadherin [Chionoecetes opilio]|uniref:Neural-cadherin n=1 Tax=Chionoecetes opilio TaxID=41210 RepID=A0A8J4Y1T4_CHIOP|nr:Neural-cadherin [Chionoecetes opilio]